jgi:flagellar hook-basal body complex protein FliE
MSIPAIPPLSGLTPSVPVSGMSGTTVANVNPSQGPSGEFGNLVTQGIDQLQALQSRTDNLAVQAATGDLTSIHDYTIAATESSVATQLTVAVRNKAIDAFNEIMRMQA